MARRIPKSKKHKKLKFVDPCYRGSIRNNRNQRSLLPNEPPTEKDDVQEVPHDFKEFVQMKNKMKEGKLRKKKKKKIVKDDFIVVDNNIVDNDDVGNKTPRRVKQRKNESRQSFFNRLQKNVDQAKAEAKVEAKYNIKLVNIDKHGNAKFIDGAKECTDRKREKRKNFKERKEEKKRLKLDDGEFDLKREKIRFGEVVSAPPTLTVKPKKAPEVVKPGKKQLHLKKMLENASQEAQQKTSDSANTKWKDMPLDKRKSIENERSRAIQMYRLMKKGAKSHE